jgi:hypothetical protein
MQRNEARRRSSRMPQKLPLVVKDDKFSSIGDVFSEAERR